MMGLQAINRQRGLTLLEILIALSIFSLIGVASYQVLNTTIHSQQVGDAHSTALSQQQKALRILDQDLQQLITRNVRMPDQQDNNYLLVNQNVFPLEFSRGGRRNPLLLPRSSIQRIAYDLGPHPESDDRESKHYRDERSYLRRHVWPGLDREPDTAPLIQVLLNDVTELTVAVISEQGRHEIWPLVDDDTEKKVVQPLAIELIWVHDGAGQTVRIYPVLQ
ncbi:MAG TPA: type II secretion system protein GspJ [Porticoccus sp.]|nr:type II secretion system protein GspJ [Porticoccus sp.]